MHACVGKVEGAVGDSEVLQVVALAVDDPQVTGLAVARGDSMALAHEDLGLGWQAQEARVQVARHPVSTRLERCVRRAGCVLALGVTEQHDLRAVLAAPHRARRAAASDAPLLRAVP